jgi:hypothetical protein
VSGLFRTNASECELAGEPRRNDSYVLHGLTNLPVRWKVRES